MAEGKIFSLPGPEDPRRKKPRKSLVPPAGKLHRISIPGQDHSARDSRETAENFIKNATGAETFGFFVTHHQKLLALAHFLQNLGGYVPREAVILERQAQFKNSSLEELGLLLAASTESDWQTSPSRFHALIREIKSRINIEGI